MCSQDLCIQYHVASNKELTAARYKISSRSVYPVSHIQAKSSAPPALCLQRLYRLIIQPGEYFHICTVCIVLGLLYVVHCTLYTVHCTLYTTVQCTLSCTVYSAKLHLVPVQCNHPQSWVGKVRGNKYSFAGGGKRRLYWEHGNTGADREGVSLKVVQVVLHRQIYWMLTLDS